jgi:hypothetical protein
MGKAGIFIGSIRDPFKPSQLNGKHITGKARIFLKLESLSIQPGQLNGKNVTGMRPFLLQPGHLNKEKEKRYSGCRHMSMLGT